MEHINGQAALAIWTVYDHPSDFPDVFVARKYLAGQGVAVATDDTITSPSIEALREVFLQKGLTCIVRDASDDSKIVESWL